MTGESGCGPDELRVLFLFEKLTDDQLNWLSSNGTVETVEPGTVYTEGEPAMSFYVLIEGQIALSRMVGPDDIETTRTSQPGVYAGAWQAFLGDRIPQLYNSSMRALTPCRFFVLPAEMFSRLMAEWFPMALHLLEGLFFGIQDTQRVIGQRERLLALGSLSAGLTHELNNPAAAAVRAAAALGERFAGLNRAVGSIAGGDWDSATVAALSGLQDDAVHRLSEAPNQTPLQASDLEDEISDWFADHGVSDGWEHAAAFVQAGLGTDWLDQITAAVTDEQLVAAVRWLTNSLETQLLLAEIGDSTRRILTLVGAAKQYSQLDRSPQQTADIHELLESTLVMLAGRMGPDITVVRDFDPAVGEMSVYPAELNQVWTNLIDNAIAAMDGHGTLTVRTAIDDDFVLVEVGDTGSGIPPNVQERIFEPFFTTKPVGQGTGLGLDISWRIVAKRHRGDLRVQSVPGNTRFQVRLPLHPAGVAGGMRG